MQCDGFFVFFAKIFCFNNIFHIELNHYRSLEGIIGKEGRVMIEENTLNREEQQFYDRHNEEINGTLKQLVEIYEAVY